MVGTLTTVNNSGVNDCGIFNHQIKQVEGTDAMLRITGSQCGYRVYIKLLQTTKTCW